VRILLKTLDTHRVDGAVLQTINSRLCEVLQIRPAPKEPAKQIMTMLDTVASKFNGHQTAARSLASKVLKNADFLNLEVPAILGKVERLIAHGVQPTGLDEMFAPAFDLIPLTTRSDYRQYVPEICHAFVSLHESVMVMKPFASTLNNIFTQFDCKFTSFTPGSKSHQFLKSQIYALHESLNRLVPSKINSLVFLVLSRFVALLSSFMSALAAGAMGTVNEKQRNAFYEAEVGGAPK
jgi:hypothetical protein